MKKLRFAAFLVVTFLWLPMVFLFLKGFRVEAFQRLLEKPALLEALGSSVALALVSATVATFMATLTAFWFPALRPRARNVIEKLLYFPMLLPEMTMGLSLLAWFLKLGIPLGWTSLGLGHFAFSYAFCVLIMKARVEFLDRTLIEAAKDLGAKKWGVLRHALLPQLVPGLVASFVTAFSLSLDDFLISFFVKGLDQVTLPIQIYSMLKVRLGAEVYALSSLLMFVSVLVVYGSQIWAPAKRNIRS